MTEFLLDTPKVRAFVDDVRAAVADAESAVAACAAIRPAFAALLADDEWLPAAYQADAPTASLGTPRRGRAGSAGAAGSRSGMGGGIGQWALVRDDDLSLFSLVVPSGAATPIHDHLAWGLVGLYRGAQDEEIYRHEAGELRLVERRALAEGDFYELHPPLNDVHRVRTTSEVTSVSIHLLTNDTGCVWRHRYEEDGGVQPFRSGYVNTECEEESA